MRCVFSDGISKNRCYQPSFCTVGGKGPKWSYQPCHPCMGYPYGTVACNVFPTINPARPLRVRAGRTRRGRRCILLVIPDGPASYRTYTYLSLALYCALCGESSDDSVSVRKPYFTDTVLSFFSLCSFNSLLPVAACTRQASG